MRLLKLTVLSFAAAAASLFLPVGARAGALDADSYFDNPNKSMKTLVVIGNFVKPRLLAELARKDAKTPYILLPAPGDSRVFFCPAGKGPALEIREGDLAKFIDFIKPFRIAVVGESRLVPQTYLGAFAGGKAELLNIDSDNWYANATTLGNLVESKSLPERFKEELAKIEAGKWALQGLKGEGQSQPGAAVLASPAAQGQPGPAVQDSQAPALIEQNPVSKAPPSSEPMILMPPSASADEPVLLVPAAETKQAKPRQKPSGK